MYGIGTVARLAQVSVRTLRHYDDVGLLRPAHVDPVTGYRRYLPEQLLRLHRILVLRDLGVPLAEIVHLVDDGVTVEQLRGILRLRQAEGRALVAAQTAQLTRVELRLAQLEEEPAVAGYDIIVKRLEPEHVVTVSEDLADVDEIADAGGRMWPRLHAALDRHGIKFGGVSLLLYEDSGDAQRPIRLTAALPIPSGLTIADDGLTTVDLPPEDRAATTVVHGPPTKYGDAFQAIQAWVEQTGDRVTSFEREVYLDCDGPWDSWVAELQTVLEPPSAAAAG